MKREQAAYRFAHFAARDYRVNKAVFKQIFRALKAVGQCLTDCLLDDARTCKAY